MTRTAPARTALTAAALTAAALAAAPAASAAPGGAAAPQETAVHEALVDAWYQDFLGREADAASAFWVGRLDAGEPHADVLRSITRSQEHASAVVRTLYDVHLDRAPDPGAQYWVDGIRAGGAPEWVEQNVLASREFLSRSGANPVDEWYGAVLGRSGTNPANAGEEAYWAGQAAASGPLAALRGIWYSAEGVDRRTDGIFARLLERDPTRPELDYFYGPVRASAIEATVSIAVTPEYTARAVAAQED